MVREQIVRVRRLVTLHLVVLAFLTATLVAAGSGSLFLPLLVFLVGVSSLLFVDWLEWIALHHSLAYIGMVLGTLLALSDYFSEGQSTADQLYAIASLLIYPEIVIMLQRKNMRLFEQMAMFLLLEIIVAALINDNVLFGVLLAPIVLLWVSSLLLLTRYAALIQLAPDLDRPTPRLIELLGDAWRKAHSHRSAEREKMLEVIQPDEASRGRMGLMTLLGQSVPIGIMSLVFAGLYFYLLPRAAVENLPPLSGGPRTGLSESLSLGEMGKLLTDSSPVLRLSLRDAESGKPYLLAEPPYIRGTVVSRYFRKNDSASFESDNHTGALVTDRFQSLNSFRYFNRQTAGDRVAAHFEILSPDGSLLPCIAPMINHDPTRKFLAVLPYEWRLINKRSDQVPGRSETEYTLLTTAFLDGRERAVLPDSRPLLGQPTDEIAESSLAGLAALSQGHSAYSETQWIEDLMVRVSERHPDAQSPVELAHAVEEYLSMSGEFTYSLDLSGTIEQDLDPIEDFVINQKRGHCQYFAATLTMVLRHAGIPARIILGYHPLEYNELGDYFAVRRSDAHAWVEAYFTQEQLQEAGLDTRDLGATGGWLRLDATPAGPGSNAGSELRAQQDQAADYAQRLWKDYILNSRQRAEENSFYGPLQDSARRTYREMMESAKDVIKQMRDSQFVGGAISQESWFSWPVAVLIMLVGGSMVVIWRVVRWLPRWAPRLAKKLGLRQGLDDVRQNFYRHCLRMLRRAGFVRRPGQTADEYTRDAAQTLAVSRQWNGAARELSVLTSAYYRLRFGGKKSLRAEEQQAVVAALDELERRLKLSHKD